MLGEIERAGLVAERRRARRAQIRERRRGARLAARRRHSRPRASSSASALAEPVAGAVAAEAMRAGLIVNAANDSTIRIAPPLIIGDAEIDEFADRFGRALDAVAARPLTRTTRSTPNGTA